MVGHDVSEVLGLVLGGDVEALARIAHVGHSVLLGAQFPAERPLVVTREATVAVLQGLLDQRTRPADVQAWASFVLRGYVAGHAGSGPIQSLSIDFDEAWEDAIVEAVARLDEIGDVVDGEVTPSEILGLLQLLGGS